MIVKFSHNWNNKLNCKVFTTIRSFSENKLNYYQSAIGKEFSVELNGKHFCRAKLLIVEHMQLDEIPDALKCMDTGLSSHIEAFELFRKFGIESYQRALILTFMRF